MNIYNNPEKFGLEIMASMNDDSHSSQFDMFILWRSVETGELFYGGDAGCSCPVPFEGMEINDLTKLTFETYQQLYIAVQDYDNECTGADRNAFLFTALTLLKR